MVALTNREILDELRKFGINTKSELGKLLKEYKTYYRKTINNLYAL